MQDLHAGEVGRQGVSIVVDGKAADGRGAHVDAQHVRHLVTLCHGGK